MVQQPRGTFQLFVLRNCEEKECWFGPVASWVSKCGRSGTMECSNGRQCRCQQLPLGSRHKNAIGRQQPPLNLQCPINGELGAQLAQLTALRHLTVRSRGVLHEKVRNKLVYTGKFREIKRS